MHKSKVISGCGDYYSTPGLRELCHKVKDGDRIAIWHAARMLKPLLPQKEEFYLVPVPCSEGKCYTTDLAYMLAPLHVAEILEREPGTEPLYEKKLRGEAVTPEDAGIRLARGAKVPQDVRVILVDNVYATGTTFRACVKALGRDASMLCLATDGNVKQNKYL